MREKYIEERFPRYFEFGRNTQTGLVDVASADYNTIVSVTKEQAELLIADRDKIVDKLVEVCQAFDKIDSKSFDALWYGH